MGALVIALLFTVLGIALSYLISIPLFGSNVADAVVCGFAGGYIGLVVGATIGSVIDSAVTMLFVCFLKSPEFLKVLMLFIIIKA
jgi:hypothetical protein